MNAKCVSRVRWFLYGLITGLGISCIAFFALIVLVNRASHPAKPPESTSQAAVVTESNTAAVSPSATAPPLIASPSPRSSPSTQSTATSTPPPTYTPLPTYTLLPTYTPLPTHTMAPAATLTPAGITFETVCKINTGDYTELQLQAYADSLVGKQVTDWVGYVYDAKKDRVEIAMKPKGLLWSRNLELLGIPLDVGSRLQINQQVRFSGRIKKAEVFWGTICNPLVIENVVLTLE